MLRASQRLRHQLAFVVVAAIVLPALVAFLILEEPMLGKEQTSASLLASGLSALATLFIYRQTSDFPGVRQTENVFPALALSYGLAFSVLLAFRIEYGRIILFSGFAFCMLGVFLTLLREQRSFAGFFWLVPYGNIERVRQIESIEWRDLTEPIVPTVAQRGIVVDLRADLAGEWERMLAKSALRGIPVYHVKQLEEAITGRVDIEHLSENTFGGLSPNQAYTNLKRLADLAFSVAILPILLPFLLLVAILIKLDSPGPIFFRQQRVGYRGHSFRVFKFRTMTDEQPKSYEPADPRLSAMTQPDDQRITRLGKYLRRYRIDELPQVFNVLLGQMSWIGPRPEAQELSTWYAEHLPFYSYRHIVRPGISGWAQVTQGHVFDIQSVHEKLRYDFFYIKHFSFWLDIVIVARTVRVILNGFGSK